jgi:hypothetical protein
MVTRDIGRPKTQDGGTSLTREHRAGGLNPAAEAAGFVLIAR